MTQPPPENPYGNQDPNQPYGSQPYGNQDPNQPYGSQPYGSQPPPPPYGAPQVGQPGQPNVYGQPPPYGAYVAQDHPRAMLILILGILSLVICSLCGPFAWVMGNRAIREIDASGGQLGGRGTVQAGRILGIIATVLLVLAVLFFVVIIIVAIAGASTSTSP